MECENHFLEKTTPIPETAKTGFCKKTWTDIYNLFYSCESKETKYYLQFSSFYNSEEIKIDDEIPGNLDSYIIELSRFFFK